MPRITGYRKAHFNAAHRLYKPDWSDEKNSEVFGKCNNPYFHGHNYEIIVAVTGEIDPDTGYVFDLGILKNLIKTEIEDAFDHKNLNLEDSLKSYEKGVSLVKKAQESLNKIEKKIQILSANNELIDLNQNE